MSAAAVAARLSGQGKLRSKKRGAGWMAPCPCHADGSPSLSITDGRSGMVLWHCHAGCDQQKVTAAIHELMGDQRKPLTRAARQPVAPLVDYGYTPLPADILQQSKLGRDLLLHDEHGLPSRLWTYRMPGNLISCLVGRYDHEDGKEIIPYTLWEDRSGKQFWRRKAWPESRPLYQLDVLAAKPDAPVIYCEGEKAADAAQLLFPNWVATTHPGGGNAIGKADLTPLHGRKVIIMPDADKPGMRMAEELARALDGLAIVKLLVWPTVRGDGSAYVIEDGDDAADHLERGWSHEEVCQARRLVPMLRPFDLPIDFGQGAPESGWFYLKIDGDAASLSVLRKDGPVDTVALPQGWRSLEPVVSHQFNERLRRYGHRSGRFPATGGVHLAGAYGAELFGLLMHACDDLGAAVTAWLSGNQATRKKAWSRHQKVLSS